MCRVCNKRPEVPDERHGRCEACARSGRIAYRLRLGARPTGELVVRAGELSPRALRQKVHAQLTGFTGHPTSRPHLTLHDVELVFAKDRLEAVRVAPALATRGDAVMAALTVAAERTDAAW
ncbi:MAG TPA: hypothetical protein VFO60_10845 [Candidatus Dormibacteraeota bacterium]|nr:hypothetical protein [Candidatus Dormibacteraeota bacterium]